MHELSLAQGLLDQLAALARQHRASRIVRVEVAIGRQAGIVVDSFVFGFNAIRTTLEVTREAALVVTATDGCDLVLNRVEMEDKPAGQRAGKGEA